MQYIQYKKMEKKKYIKPNIALWMMETEDMIAATGGEPNNPSPQLETEGVVISIENTSTSATRNGAFSKHGSVWDWDE